MRISPERVATLCSIATMVVGTTISVIGHWDEIRSTWRQVRQSTGLLPREELQDPPGYAEAHRQLYDDLRTPVELWPSDSAGWRMD